MFSQIAFAPIDRGHLLSLRYYASCSLFLHPPIFLKLPNYVNCQPFFFIFPNASNFALVLLSSTWVAPKLLPLFNIRGLRYACFPCRCTGFHIHTSKTVKLLSLQLSLLPPTPPCHHCLNDRSVHLSYASQDRWIHLPSQ